MSDTGTALQISQEDFNRRMRTFALRMSIEERFREPIVGLCERGVVTFPPFCSDPQIERDFPSHAQNCRTCMNAFVVHIYKITSDS